MKIGRDGTSCTSSPLSGLGCCPETIYLFMYTSEMLTDQYRAITPAMYIFDFLSSPPIFGSLLMSGAPRVVAFPSAGRDSNKMATFVMDTPNSSGQHFPMSVHATPFQPRQVFCVLFASHPSKTFSFLFIFQASPTSRQSARYRIHVGPRT